MCIGEIVLITSGKHDLQIGRIIKATDYSAYTVQFADGTTDDICICDMQRLQLR